MSDFYDRTLRLFGAESVERLQRAHVCITGLGGVGSYAAEALARAGIGTLTLVDADCVDETNINRQLYALNSTIGQLKTDVAAARCLDINPHINIHKRPVFLRDETLQNLFNVRYDYIVDAIDSLSSKAYLIHYAVEKNVPIIVSLGSAGKLDPAQIRLCRLNQTSGDPLARALRHRLRGLGTDLSAVQTVYSPEACAGEVLTYEDGQSDALGKRSVRGTVSYLPAVFGLYAASAVIRALTMCEK